MTFPAHLALLAIRIYQGVHLAFFRNCCRFHPTCSDYTAEAFQVHGALKGSLLAAGRILRCQPLCKGGWDPVPPAHPHGGQILNPAPYIDRHASVPGTLHRLGGNTSRSRT